MIIILVSVTNFRDLSQDKDLKAANALQNTNLHAIRIPENAIHIQKNTKPKTFLHNIFM